MKKLLLIFLLSLLMFGCTKEEIAKASDNDILTLFSSETQNQDKIWVGTFQLVWNDMKNYIIKRNIEFIQEKPTKELIGLNSEEFNKNMLNPSSYYTSYGKTKPSEKEKIKKDIKEKFNETSDILDSVDWSEGKGKYYAYAMLKKEFQFLEPFDKLTSASFNKSEEKYQYFGIDDDSKEILNNNLSVLFYNNENDYAVRLYTKQDDIIYLYRTDDNKSLKLLFEDMKNKKEKYQGMKKFNSVDTLKIPNLKFKKLRNYKELCNKQIKGTDLEFSDAIETIQFELDNVGGKVKSEAIIMARLTSAMPSAKPIPRHFNFDKTFNIFLIDKDKTNPYLALRIYDLSKFIR